MRSKSSRKSQSQKRKSQIPNDEELDNINEENGVGDEFDNTPSKRSRKGSIRDRKDPESEDEYQEEENTKPSKKRPFSSRKRERVSYSEDDHDEEVKSTPKAKKGRKSKAPKVDDAESEEEKYAPKKTKRSTPSKKGVSYSKDDAEESEEENNTPKKTKRSSPSKKGVSYSEDDAEESEEENNTPKKSKRSSPSKKSVSYSEDDAEESDEKESNDYEAEDDSVKSEEEKKVKLQESKKGQKDKKSDEDEEDYEVEDVVDMELKPQCKCPVKFRVRWKGYDESSDSWIWANDMSCHDLVSSFLEVSGRKREYEEAMETKDSARSTRKKIAYNYSELDEDIEEILPSGTSTRKARSVFSSTNKQNPLKKRRPINFEVERITKVRVTKSGKEFLVKWQGYGYNERTWEPEKNLTECEDALQKFHDEAEQKKASKKKKKAKKHSKA